MKQILWTAGGLAMAVIAWGMINSSQPGGTRPFGRRDVPPVDQLAGQLQQAWADHHTTV